MASVRVRIQFGDGAAQADLRLVSPNVEVCGDFLVACAARHQHSMWLVFSQSGIVFCSSRAKSINSSAFSFGCADRIFHGISPANENAPYVQLRDETWLVCRVTAFAGSDDHLAAARCCLAVG